MISHVPLEAGEVIEIDVDAANTGAITPGNIISDSIEKIK